MIVLGIDPGPVESAGVLYDTEAKTVRMEPGIVGNSELLAWIKSENSLCLIGLGHLVIEMPHTYALTPKRNKKTGKYRSAQLNQNTYEMTYWVGRFVEAYAGGFARLFRRDICRHLCGPKLLKGKAPYNAAVAQWFGVTVGSAKGTQKAPGPLYGIKSHMWDALAVAITWAETTKKVQ